MTKQEITNILEKQRAFYIAGGTLSVKHRIDNLKKLYQAVKKYEREINEALKSDLGKAPTRALCVRSAWF